LDDVLAELRAMPARSPGVADVIRGGLGSGGQLRSGAADKSADHSVCAVALLELREAFVDGHRLTVRPDCHIRIYKCVDEVFGSTENSAANWSAKPRSSASMMAQGWWATRLQRRGLAWWTSREVTDAVEAVEAGGDEAA
jgi:hypothetical protein